MSAVYDFRVNSKRLQTNLEAVTTNSNGSDLLHRVMGVRLHTELRSSARQTLSLYRSRSRLGLESILENGRTEKSILEFYRTDWKDRDGLWHTGFLPYTVL